MRVLQRWLRVSLTLVLLSIGSRLVEAQPAAPVNDDGGAFDVHGRAFGVRVFTMSTFSNALISSETGVTS
jgi:hypothetical protein